MPVPEVRGVRESEFGVVAIEMEYIPGDPLGNVLSSMTAEERAEIARQLRGWVEELRGLKQPEPEMEKDEDSDDEDILRTGFVGGLDGWELPVEWRGGERRVGGPWSDTDEFCDWLVDGNVPDEVPGILRHMARGQLGKAAGGVRFSHGDLVARNVIVKRREDIPGDEGVGWKIVGIVDWELAGWWPEWWEFWRMVGGLKGRGKKEWADIMEGIWDGRGKMKGYEREVVAGEFLEGLVVRTG